MTDTAKAVTQQQSPAEPIPLSQVTVVAVSRQDWRDLAKKHASSLKTAILNRDGLRLLSGPQLLAA